MGLHDRLPFIKNIVIKTRNLDSKLRLNECYCTKSGVPIKSQNETSSVVINERKNRKVTILIPSYKYTCI